MHKLVYLAALSIFVNLCFLHYLVFAWAPQQSVTDLYHTIRHYSTNHADTTGSRSNSANYKFTTPIWSKGYNDLVIRDNPFLSVAYLAKGAETHMTYDDVFNIFSLYASQLKGYVYLHTSSDKYTVTHSGNDIIEFAAHVAGYLRHNIVLITADGDAGIPSDITSDCSQAYHTLISNPYITAWYTQNYAPYTDINCGSMSLLQPYAHKLKPLPIGLDLHTLHHYRTYADKLRAMIDVRRQADTIGWANRRNRVLVDVSSKSHPERRLVEGMLKKANSSHIDMHSRSKFDNTLRRITTYKFAASVRGNGLDCHRTWELLYMRTIPIVHTSSLDSMFAGLPVVIVQSWNEMLDSSNLDKWSQQYGAMMLSGDPDEWLNPWRWLKSSGT